MWRKLHTDKRYRSRWSTETRMACLRVPYFPDPDYTFKTTYTKRLKNGNMVWIVQLISNKKLSKE